MRGSNFLYLKLMKTPLSIILLLALLQATPSFSQELRKPVVVSIQKMKGFSKDLNREVIVDSVNAWLGNDRAIVFVTDAHADEVDFVVDIIADWQIGSKLQVQSERKGQQVYSGTMAERTMPGEGMNGWTQSPQNASPVSYWYQSSEEVSAKGVFKLVIRDQKNDMQKLGNFRIGVEGTDRSIDQMTISSLRDCLVSFFCLN